MVCEGPVNEYNASVELITATIFWALPVLQLLTNGSVEILVSTKRTDATLWMQLMKNF